MQSKPRYKNIILACTGLIALWLGAVLCLIGFPPLQAFPSAGLFMYGALYALLAGCAKDYSWQTAVLGAVAWMVIFAGLIFPIPYPFPAKATGLIGVFFAALMFAPNSGLLECSQERNKSRSS